ncbi:MAG: TerB family tellurite resistance protein [Pseudomonadota bacterium]
MLSSLLERLRGRLEEDDAPEDLVPLAAATLLIEVALADHEVSAEELDVVRQALKTQFALEGAEVEALIEDSKREHDASVGLQNFTRTLVEAWDEAERFELVVQLWRLAQSDANVDRFEEHMIRRIAELLYVSHARFIEAKQTARSSR